MPRYIEVTPEQVQAARLAVRAYETAGEEPDPFLAKLANARTGDPRQPDQGATAAEPEPFFPAHSPAPRKRWVPRIGAGMALSAVALLVASLLVFGVSPDVQGAGKAHTLLQGVGDVVAACLLSVLPGWLHIRFTGQRVAALWTDYVLALHRLGWDEPGFLPRPPERSRFFQEWLFGDGPLYSQKGNLYRQKFEAQFGTGVVEEPDGTKTTVRADAMVPALVATAVFAAGWSAVVIDLSRLADPTSFLDIQCFAFIGVYLAVLLDLIARFRRNDLRPAAYSAAVLRLVVVLLIVGALNLLLDGAAARGQAAVAFTVGLVPPALIRLLQLSGASILRQAIPTLSPDYPLAQLQGLSYWYETQLLEAGIEDMQNLKTANLVDLILQTRVPVGRLVDWIDQATLYVHLDRPSRTSAERRLTRHAERGGTGRRAGTDPRSALRQLGIRTATDFLTAFPPDQLDGEADTEAGPTPASSGRQLPDGLDVNQMRTLARVLDADPSLVPVWNWHRRAVADPNVAQRPLDSPGRSTGSGAVRTPGTGGHPGVTPGT